MPLIQIQYSDNLEKSVSVPDLVRQVHNAGLQTGEIKGAALRTMAMPMRDYAISDRNPDNAFVHVIVRMRKRSEDKSKAIGDTIFEAVTGFMDEQFQSRPLALSLEIVDIDTWRKNNMHDKQQ